jgi:CRP-like cAMP-binding protein
MTDSCRNCQTRHLGSFAEVSEPALQALEEAIVMKKLRRGQRLFHEGGRPTMLYCVRAGRLKLYRVTENGDFHFMRWSQPGDLLGYREALSAETYNCTAEVMEDVTVCALRASVLLELLDSSPQLGRALLRRLVHEASCAERRLLGVVHYPIRRRLAALLMEASSLDETVTLRRGEMAEMLNTTGETVARVLTALVDQGLIERRGQSIRVLDPVALRRIAGL